MTAGELPTRILMTADAIGGVWTYALDLSRWLGGLGIEVVLVNMGRRCTTAQRREAWSIPTLSLLELPRKLEWMDEPWEEVDRAGAELLELERAHRPDLIHLNGYAHGAVPFAAPRVVVAHSCVLSWWQAVHHAPAPERYETYRTRVSRGLASCDRVICVSRFMQNALRTHYGFARPSALIYNGSDPERYVPGVKEPLVFGAGRFWDAAKNLEMLSACAPHVSWPIVAAGDDARPPGVQELAPPPRRSELRTLGPTSREETAALMARASIYALPARYEPFGLSVLEAALSGCALVLGDIPSLRELWHDAAVFVDPEDGAALTLAINDLIDRPSTRAELSRRARARAEPLTLARMAESYLGLYQSMLGQRVIRDSNERPNALHGG